MALNILYWFFFEISYGYWGIESSYKSQGLNLASVTKKAKLTNIKSLSLTHYSESSSNACVNRKSS